MTLSLSQNSKLGRWICTDLGVRPFQGLGKNSPAREQVVRRITRDLHTHRLLESLACESLLQVPLHRRCLPECSYANSVTRDVETTIVHRLQPRPLGPSPVLLVLPFFLRGGGGSISFSKNDTSVRSMWGTQTLLSMRQFIDDAQKQRGSLDTELEVMDSPEAEQKKSAQQEAIKALRTLFEGSLSDSQEEFPAVEPLTSLMGILPPQEDDVLNPTKEPQLYLCDDWIQPVEVMLRPKEKARARVAKNYLLVTLMSLNVGYGSLIENYQREGNPDPPALSSVTVTDDEVSMYRDELDQKCDRAPDISAGMPPPTILARHSTEVSVNKSEIAVVKDANLKMYHVMSVKQTLREDLAEHSYQFSCRAADWSRSAFCSVPMQFEPLELHVVNALGQQEVPDYFQQPAKAITEEVSVMRGPYAKEWVKAVCEEIESFKRLGVYEEVPRRHATSTPLPARLILVTKPNVHGGPARKKARIVICGNFQEVHPDMNLQPRKLRAILC